MLLLSLGLLGSIRYASRCFKTVITCRGIMFHSQIVEVSGTFLGVALTIPDGFRFHAVHDRVTASEGQVWSSLPELRRATSHLFLIGRMGSISVPHHPVANGVAEQRAIPPSVSHGRLLPAAS